MRRPLALAAVVALAGGCAVPAWVPLLGRQAAPPVAPVEPPAATTPLAAPAPPSRPAPVDDAISDRIVAVVNNDAITYMELQEALVAYRQQSRGRGGPADEQVLRDFLSRIIDLRLQLQEADREKITVEDSEVEEELADRMRRAGARNRAELEAMLAAQSLTVDAVKRRIRDDIRVSRVVRRKVALRVSVTDAEITRYLEDNRAKLEAGLSYHARHILIAPEVKTDAGWEAARIKAEMIRSQLLGGADFAELAKQHSRDASARHGGDLGTLKRGELAPEIEEQILALAPGEVSSPYRSSLGFHVFRLESQEALEGEGLQRARQQVRDILYREKYEARLQAWLREIKERAIIEIRM